MPRPAVVVRQGLRIARSFARATMCGLLLAAGAPTQAAPIVTLAPSLTELVFAAGGGDKIIAVDSSSDHPAAARTIPRIGDVSRIDVERLLALKPDLVVVWRHGNTNRELDQLESAGLRLFRLEPQRLDEV